MRSVSAEINVERLRPYLRLIASAAGRLAGGCSVVGAHGEPEHEVSSCSGSICHGATGGTTCWCNGRASTGAPAAGGTWEPPDIGTESTLNLTNCEAAIPAFEQVTC